MINLYCREWKRNISALRYVVCCEVFHHHCSGFEHIDFCKTRMSRSIKWLVTYWMIGGLVPDKSRDFLFTNTPR
jgi:hypothetical protein